MSEICILLKRVLFIPATNAVSEHSATVLCRVKTYLRSKMTQVRLSNLLILHVHKQMADDLDIHVLIILFLTVNTGCQFLVNLLNCSHAHCVIIICYS